MRERHPTPPRTLLRYCLITGVLLCLFAALYLPAVTLHPQSERVGDIWLARYRMKRLQAGLRTHLARYGVYPPDADSLRSWMTATPAGTDVSSVYSAGDENGEAVDSLFRDPQADTCFVVVVDSPGLHYQIRSNADAGYIGSWTNRYEFDAPSWE